MSNGITVEIRDYDKDSFTWIPFDSRQQKAFFLQLWAAEGYPLDVTIPSDAMFPNIYKPHSKMNVAIRGNNGKFMSYRKLRNTHHHETFERIDALPNI